MKTVAQLEPKIMVETDTVISLGPFSSPSRKSEGEGIDA